MKPAIKRLNTSDKTVYCDVDDTLIFFNDEGEHTAVVEDPGGDKIAVSLNIHTVLIARNLKKKGIQCVLWSQQGGDWARRVAEAFNLEKVFSFYLSKPLHYIDDLDYQYWMPQRRVQPLPASHEIEEENKVKYEELRKELINGEAKKKTLWIPGNVIAEYAHVEDDVYDSSRWSNTRRLIFQIEDKFYETYYEKGATEMQDSSDLWESDELECTQVEQRYVEVEEWVAVAEGEV